MPRTSTVPRSPTSIGSVAALVAGGNLREFLPVDAAAGMTSEELASMFGAEARFRMVWAGVPNADGEEEQRFGIWATDERGAEVREERARREEKRREEVMV